MIRQIKNQKDIENVLLQECVKANVNCIDIDDFIQMTIRICKPYDKIEIQTITADTVFMICDDNKLDIPIQNHFFNVSAQRQLESIYIIFGINYFPEIREAIDNDEYVHYDIEMLYLKKLLREHPSEYYQYVVREASKEIEEYFKTDEWKNFKKSLLES